MGQRKSFTDEVPIISNDLFARALENFFQSFVTFLLAPEVI